MNSLRVELIIFSQVLSSLVLVKDVVCLMQALADLPVSVYINWRASEASDTLSGVCKFELVRYIYIYICMEVRVP